MYPFREVEKKWAKKWLETRIYEPDLDSPRRQGRGRAKKPYYNLMMFPYPSAEGLHVGNMYAFTGSDVYGRYQRMLGNDVFEPIGLDGFGIHSENYALKIKKHPMEQAKVSEKNFYRQLQMIGNGFAWEERLETYDPDYYKWTQWVFVQMWKHGLAYRKRATVNWCPHCKTVLADEQVVDGKCERCATVVTKRELKQWFFKITKYAEKLLKNLEKIDWSENVKVAQRNWIGKSEGALLTFPVRTVGGAGDERPQRVASRRSNGPNASSAIEVFTTRPDTILGATYMVLAPEHELVEKLKDSIKNWKAVESYVKKTKSKTENERIREGRTKTGVELKGVRAINPATKKEIPVWISDYVLASYGTGAIMAVPAYDLRDMEFAKKFKLPAPKAKLVDGEKITKQVGGRKEVHYHLRDWLISRQRYWGPPIPMVYCEKCAKEGRGEQRDMPGWYAVPEKNLPVPLPHIKNFRPTGTGKAPLATSPSFYNTKCLGCGGAARRETDVSDTFLDSAWYYIGYLMKLRNRKVEFGDSAFVKLTRKWLPVDMYIGGAEHSVLHLFYSRFLAMAFKDMGYLDFEEPFTTFRAHGLLIAEGAKMSKSKGNVVNPDEYINKFGADTVRMYLMFLGPFSDGGDWRDAGIVGVVRFLDRVWKLGNKVGSVESVGNVGSERLQRAKRSNSSSGSNASPWIHGVIKKVTDDISELKYNTAIAELMTALNRFEKLAQSSSKGEGVSKKDFEVFLLLLAPFAPFISEELWVKLGNKYSIHKESWPTYDKRKLVEDTIRLVVQVNGKVRATVEVKKGISQKEAEALAMRENAVKRHLKGKPKKVIFVKDRLINFVA